MLTHYAPAELRDQDIASLSALQPVVESLQFNNHQREAQVFADVISLCTLSPDFNGLGLVPDTSLDASQTQHLLFLLSAHLESLNSSDRTTRPLPPLSTQPANRRPMTLTEKIFAHHDVEQRGYVVPGQTMSVRVDWILASDASWGGMERTYRQLNEPGIWRNDRFWLSLDHVVDPRINERPEVKELIRLGEEAKTKFKMTDYQGQNVGVLCTSPLSEYEHSEEKGGTLTTASTRYSTLSFTANARSQA